MFEVGSYVVYKRELCMVEAIKKNYRFDKDYYILSSVHDSSLHIEVPVEKQQELLRSIISHEEAKKIIHMIPDIPTIQVEERFLESEYKNLLRGDSYEDLVKIIKTAYERNNLRKTNGKKISEKDDYYFQKAEKFLYSELAIALDMNYDEAKNYIIESILEKIEKTA